jgi:hypothetical protein
MARLSSLPTDPRPYQPGPWTATTDPNQANRDTLRMVAEMTRGRALSSAQVVKREPLTNDRDPARGRIA